MTPQLTGKEKAQALAGWLLPQYLASDRIDPVATAQLFGELLIAKLGQRALNVWVAEMQYTLAGIEDTGE